MRDDHFTLAEFAQILDSFDIHQLVSGKDEKRSQTGNRNEFQNKRKKRNEEQKPDTVHDVRHLVLAPADTLTPLRTITPVIGKTPRIPQTKLPYTLTGQFPVVIGALTAVKFVVEGCGCQKSLGRSNECHRSLRE
ncbi:MAG: hypothetical protein U0103_11585 [Candidatus Obscuribacterales bacterium]